MTHVTDRKLQIRQNVFALRNVTGNDIVFFFFQSSPAVIPTFGFTGGKPPVSRPTSLSGMPPNSCLEHRARVVPERLWIKHNNSSFGRSTVAMQKFWTYTDMGYLHSNYTDKLGNVAFVLSISQNTRKKKRETIS